MLSRYLSYFSVIVSALAVSQANPVALGADPPIKVLTVSRSPAPVPALGHRLVPLESELTPGDAAPIYLRLTSEISREKLRDLGEKTQAWIALPLDQFPVDSARLLIDSWRPQLRQIEYGARRQSCEWNYSIPEETEHIIEISLADAQVMRIWARLVALEARVEIAGNDLRKAARTIEAGLSFSRQVGDGPFLINMLVGVRAALEMLDRVDDLVGQPGAPNLYWSLTALPRPLIAARRAVANEYKMCEWMLPDMTDLDRSRTGAEWTARLDRFRGQLHKLAAAYSDVKGDRRVDNLAEFRKWVLPEALKYVKGRLGTWKSLHEDQVILMYFGGNYRDLYDEIYKAAYLPFPQAEEFYRRGHERLYVVKQGPLDLFARLIANIEAGHRSEVMLDRKVAALRVVEALRLHADDAGELPKSLDEVKVVPIPGDPYSGKPFDYSLKGDTATVEGSNSKGAFGLTYQITLRK